MKKSIRKRICAILLTTALLLTGVLAGCGDDAPGGGTDTAQAEYAVILKTLSNDFWATMKTGIEEEAEKQGVTVDIFAANSEEDTEGQLRILENCIAKGYKAIGVAPLSPTNLLNGVAQANQKGIYVMNIDEQMDMETLKNVGGSVIAFATTDNVAVGEQAANYIVGKLTAGGQVAIIEGKAGNASGEARKQGATDAFRAATGVELVASQPADWDRQKALDTAASILQQYPELGAFYCCNDTMALGALQAVKNAGKLGQVLVVGTDGAAEAIESIRAGELTATIAQDSAEIGATSLRKMIEAVQSGAAIDPEAQPETIPVEAYIVEQDTVG